MSDPKWKQRLDEANRMAEQLDALRAQVATLTAERDAAVARADSLEQSVIYEQGERKSAWAMCTQMALERDKLAARLKVTERVLEAAVKEYCFGCRGDLPLTASDCAHIDRDGTKHDCRSIGLRAALASLREDEEKGGVG